MVELLHQPLEVLLPVVLPQLLRRRPKKRKRVRKILHIANYSGRNLLTNHTEKEESDEDMGFGLFD